MRNEKIVLQLFAVVLYKVFSNKHDSVFHYTKKPTNLATPLPFMTSPSVDPSTFCFLRPLSPSSPCSLSSVITLANLCYRTPIGWSNESHIIQGPRITLAALQTQLQHPDCIVLLATTKVNEEIIGCIQLTSTTEMVTGKLSEKVGLFGLFAVKPEWQSKGVGNWMLKQVENICVQRKWPKLMAEVVEIRSELVNWYKRCGFEIWGRVDDARPFVEERGEKLLENTGYAVMGKVLEESR